MILLRQMIILFALMVVGYLCRRYKVLSQEGLGPLSMLVTQIGNPALILSASIENPINVSAIYLLKTVGFCFLIYGLLIAISKIVVSFFHEEKAKKNIYLLMLVFSNIGFMGIPLVKMVYGPKEFFYITVFQIPYDILIYTYGVGLISSGKNHLSGKELLKSLVNPGSVAAVGAMFIYMFPVHFSTIISEPLGMLGNLAAPLSMIVIGASFFNINIKEIFTNWKLIIFSGIKLLVMPFVLIFGLKLLGISLEMQHVCLIVFATPIGSMVVMFAEQFKTEHKLATEAVAFTTLLSVVTIPLLQFIL